MYRDRKFKNGVRVNPSPGLPPHPRHPYSIPASDRDSLDSLDSLDSPDSLDSLDSPSACGDARGGKPSFPTCEGLSVEVGIEI
jgi:hypothetical protein